MTRLRARARPRARPPRRARARGRDPLRRAARALRRRREPATRTTPSGSRRRSSPRSRCRRDGFTLRFRSRRRRRRARGGAGRGAARVPARRALVPLLGGGLAPLPADWLARTASPLADLLAAREPTGRVPAALLPDLARAVRRARRSRRRRASSGSPRSLAATWPETPLPADLARRAAPLPARGRRTGSRSSRGAGLGALLADDMGLGKTLQALARSRGRTLVVRPTSVLVQLGGRDRALPARRSRPASTTAPAARSTPAPTSRSRPTRILRIDASALADVALGHASCSTRRRRSRTPTARSRARPSRSRRASRLALTGTPVENRLDELWSQLHFTEPAACSAAAATSTSATRARSRRATPRRPSACASASGRSCCAACKRDVAPELPPRTEVVLHFELDADERARLRRASRAATQRRGRRAARERRQRAGGARGAAAPAPGRAATARCCPGQTRRAARRSSSCCSSRSTTAAAEGHKALVFSQWTSLLDLVEPHLARARASRFARLDGATRDRGARRRALPGRGGPAA